MIQLSKSMTRGCFKLTKWVTDSEPVREGFLQSDSGDKPLNQESTHSASRTE